MTGKQPLSVTHPELAKQAIGWDPSLEISNYSLKKLWHCPKGHDWVDSISHRIAGRGCSICAGKQVLAGFNDLQSKNPELAAQAFGWDPTIIAANSNKLMAWKCALGHDWEASVASRNKGNGCPYCSGSKVLVGYNDLQSQNPVIASQAFGWDPTSVTTGSSLRKQWRCEQGHDWFTSVANRSFGYGCPVCSGRTVWAGLNDLASQNPGLASEAAGWDPSMVTVSSHEVKLWHCKEGHDWKTSVANRSSGSGCSICSGKTVLAGFNDLAYKNPALAKEAHGWDPSTVTANSHASKLWKCHLGHEWRASIANRSIGTSCPICSGKTVLAGFNDLAYKNPTLASQAQGWDPSTVTVNSNQSKLWLCVEGHTWKAQVSDRSRGNGCPTCSNSGFDPNAEAWLYFLRHDIWEMLQIGITNFPKDRLMRHTKLGWNLVELRGPMDGLIAREWETSILQMLKRHGAKLAAEEVAGKFDGYTEAWLTDSYKVKSIRDLMDAVEADEGIRNGSMLEGGNGL